MRHSVLLYVNELNSAKRFILKYFGLGIGILRHFPGLIIAVINNEFSTFWFTFGYAGNMEF